MEKFELINELLDGNLAELQEKDLFFEIASNDELRQDFRQLLSLNRSSSAISKGYYIPQSSTDKIFGAVVITSFNGGFIGLLQTIKSSPVFMPIAASILTALLIFGISDISGYKFQKESDMNKVPLISSNVESWVMPDSVKNKSENSTIEKLNLNSNDTKSISMISTAREEKTRKENSITHNFEKNDNSYINISKSQYLLDEAVNINISERTNHLNNFVHIEQNVYNQISDDIISGLPLSIEIRNSQYWNIPAATITPSKFADFHNMTIDIKYNFESGISLGADLRRETFFQKFDFFDELNQYTIIEQQPNFTTLSVNLAYHYDTDSPVIPFAQVSVGGNEVGAVSCLMVGAGYRISDNFMLNISSELSNMTYSYKGTIFNSPKFGFNYGISYRF
ncbi:MAG: hypothetical protein KIT33_01465 [Candidatus Kapabacteria bacterium]|nr:hypothetical protein [Ignavibacteriota bacterium]MCW5883618.1 hypothetical protein [Candidatus Kapabacteria bacterium]